MQSSFQVGDNVVYPFHGVGQIVAVVKEMVAGTEVSLYVIDFAKQKMTVRIPEASAARTGLRHLSPPDLFLQVIEVLKGGAKVNRGVMWAKRAMEYGSKINSGDVFLLAEVVRDLYPRMKETDCSYSEKAIYEVAFERFAHEYSIALGIGMEDAKAKVSAILQYAGV